MKKDKNSPFKYTYLLGKSAKIDKSDKYTDYQTYIMYLSPYNISGTNICPNASVGCASACLNMSGRGKFNNVQNARLQRTMHYLTDRVGFLKRLRAEILYHATINDKIAIRLGGTSDLNMTSFINQMHKVVPHVKWYDYTKNPKIAIRASKMSHYDVTFSRSEDNEDKCIEMLSKGINVAVVFDKQLPNKWKGWSVIDGDITDTRFLDRKGVVVGLKFKGSKKDKQIGIDSGFVIPSL